MEMKLKYLFVMGGAFAMLSWGCAATQPTNYYMLSALSDFEDPAHSDMREIELSLGIGPIDLPKYLDRPQIVTRSSRNELALAEYHKWAEPLDANLTRALTENLSALLGTDHISSYPWKRSTPIDFQIGVKVLRFDAQSDGTTSLIARWKIMTDEGTKMLITKKSRFHAPAAVKDYEMVVSAMNTDLAHLSLEIADAIKQLQGKNLAKLSPVLPKIRTK